MSNIIAWPKHLRRRHPEGERCYEASCHTCNLFICARCLCAEGSLPTDCPGEPVSEARQDAIYNEELNYIRDGGWVCPEDRKWRSSW